MATEKNVQVVLASRPHGEPVPENFKIVEAAVPEPGPGQMLLRTIYLSLDPYMRGRMSEGPSYAAPVEVGGVMEGSAVGVVEKSNLPQYAVGDIVVSRSGWQAYSLSNGQEVQKVNPSMGRISYALGVLGMPGFTAYTGLLNIGKPQRGEALVVAAASGAVGSVVGQVAKIKGCRAIGIAGGEQKCRFVKTELGFDDCLDHRELRLRDRLQSACPKGIDIYFENVGGAVFEAVLPLLNNFARIPVCGLISHYNDTGFRRGLDRMPLLLRDILVKRLTFRGFIVFDFHSQFSDFITDMSGWVRDGRVKYREDITDGLENAPRELIGLLKGENFGKKLIRVSPDPTVQ
jgi:hypothetical protein